MSVTERGKASPRQTWTLGDSCVSVHLGTHIDPVINVRCIALADAVERLGVPGVRDVVPTYNAVTVHFDPLVTDSARLTRELERLAASDLPSTVSATRTVEIPVVYGGESGPDLGAVAEFAECSEEDVVRLHAARAYRVYMLGFLPGFAYMGSVDPRIAMPRLDDSPPAGRRRLGWHRRVADRNLPLRYARWLAHHRPDLDEGLRCGEDRTVSVESWRLA